MVERVNGTIKNATVKATTYQNIDGMRLGKVTFTIDGFIDLFMT
jgi:hypothetical protein